MSQALQGRIFPGLLLIATFFKKHLWYSIIYYRVPHISENFYNWSFSLWYWQRKIRVIFSIIVSAMNIIFFLLAIMNRIDMCLQISCIRKCLWTWGIFLEWVAHMLYKNTLWGDSKSPACGHHEQSVSSSFLLEKMIYHMIYICNV